MNAIIKSGCIALTAVVVCLFRQLQEVQLQLHGLKKKIEKISTEENIMKQNLDQVNSRFLGKTPLSGVLPYYRRVRWPTSLSLSSFVTK